MRAADWMHGACPYSMLAPASSVLSQETRLVAQHLVTAAVTKHGLYSSGLLHSDGYLRWIDGKRCLDQLSATKWTTTRAAIFNNSFVQLVLAFIGWCW